MCVNSCARREPGAGACTARRQTLTTYTLELELKVMHGVADRASPIIPSGRLDLHAAPGRGTDFTLCLPVEPRGPGGSAPPSDGPSQMPETRERKSR